LRKLDQFRLAAYHPVEGGTRRRGRDTEQISALYTMGVDALLRVSNRNVSGEKVRERLRIA